jgi:hypothetical protein
MRWGAGKGANLNAVEVDENFWDLLQRLQAVEDNPAQPLQIGNITVSGNRMTIMLSDGVTSFGPFTLPQAAFRFTGSYEGNHDYAVFDFFTANDGLYLALLEHTSGAAFDPDGLIAGQALYQFILPFPNLYDIGFFFPGTPGVGIDAGAAMFTLIANRRFYLPEGLIGSAASLQTATTGALTLSVRKNATEIGTISIAAGATVATFALGAAVQFEAGDRMRILRPPGLDATAKDFSVNFAARKGSIGD